MTSAENSVSKHPNLKILQPPPPPYKARAFGTRDNAPPPPLPTPVQKSLTTALYCTSQN